MAGNRQKMSNGEVRYRDEEPAKPSFLDDIISASESALEVYKTMPVDMRVALETSIYPGAKPESIGAVAAYCKERGLDVLQKPVHIVSMSVKVTDQYGKERYEQRDVIMAGIGLYRIQAEQTGQHIGTSEPEFGPMVKQTFTGTKWVNEKPRDIDVVVEYPEWARVVVKKLIGGQVCEFYGKEYWIENYATQSKYKDAPNSMWTKRCRGQLGKCAEAQALRRAFPGKLGNQPTYEEMLGKELELSRITEPVDTAAQREQASKDRLKDALEPTTTTKQKESPAKAKTADKPDTKPAEADGGAVNELADMIRGAHWRDWPELLAQAVESEDQEAVEAMFTLARTKLDTASEKNKVSWLALNQRVFGKQALKLEKFWDKEGPWEALEALGVSDPTTDAEVPQEDEEEDVPFGNAADETPPEQDPIEALRAEIEAVSDQPSFQLANKKWSALPSTEQRKLTKDMVAASKRIQGGKG